MDISSVTSLYQKPYSYEQEAKELDSLKAQTDSGNEEELKKVCGDFESILLGFMMKQMRNTVPEVDFIHGGQAEEMFEEMQDQEIAKELSSSSKFGLADSLYKQLSRNIS